MPFEFKKVASHGTSNPIVARLSLQNLKILENCKMTKELKDKVGGLYLESLMKKLLRCWEIEDGFKKSFAEAAAKYKPPANPNAPVEVPQIDRLEQDAHNFLYETKNYIRDLLYVFNKLYGTSFSEASEFSKGRKDGNGKSLIEFATETFGAADARTKMLMEAVPWVEHVIAMRNAVEHTASCEVSTPQAWLEPRSLRRLRRDSADRQPKIGRVEPKELTFTEIPSTARGDGERDIGTACGCSRIFVSVCHSQPGAYPPRERNCSCVQRHFE